MENKDANRFFEKVDLDSIDGCWIWTSVKADGYGIFWLKPKQTVAHRVAYEFFFGKIPDGLHIDHLCRNRGCVNPLHMEPVTKYENDMRGESVCAKNARKAHCKHGHPFDERNTRVYFSSTGRERRVCRECHRIDGNKRYHEKNPGAKWRKKTRHSRQ